jgi:hypothetical protein
VVHVFDISQTDGEPLPEVRTAMVDGDLPVHWGKVAQLITSAGFALEVTDVDRLGEANGITDWRDHQVVVRASLPGAQRAFGISRNLASGDHAWQQLSTACSIRSARPNRAYGLVTFRDLGHRWWIGTTEAFLASCPNESNTWR